MSVTGRKEDPLILYVDFLNVDLSFDPRPKLKKGQKLKDFLDQFEREHLPDTFNLKTGKPVPKPQPRDWLEEARDLQGEMRTDLFPIAAGKQIPEKLFPTLERWVYLVEKLNEMEFTRRWDIHPAKNKKNKIIIKGWNFKPSYNQRDIWYLGLAERLEAGDLERLRLCPVCYKYFPARDKRERFCKKECKRKYDNKDSKFRIARWRAKQETKPIEKKQKRRNSLHEQKVKQFSEFVQFATSHNQDIINVGPVVVKLGRGNAREGWRMIRGWENDLKNSRSPELIYKGLPQHLKDCFLKTVVKSL